MKRAAARPILACLGSLAVFVGLRWLSGTWYANDLSGIPDEGQVPSGLLPWFLYTYRLGGSVWSDSVRCATWIAACAAYFVPPAVATSQARDRLGMVCAILLTITIVGWSWFSIPQPPRGSEHLGYFTVATVRIARNWIAVLALAGTAVGSSAAARNARRGQPLIH